VCELGAIQLNESAQILGVDSPQSRVEGGRARVCFVIELELEQVGARESSLAA